MNMTTKELRKAAFAVTFGATMGRYFGKLANGVVSGFIEVTNKRLLDAIKKAESNEKPCDDVGDAKNDSNKENEDC